ncbi:MAG: TIGR00725 family protein [Phycisphaerales bacterium]
MPPRTPRPLIAVVGSARESPEEVNAAEELGRLLIDGGVRIICGGLGGVMAGVCRGAAASPHWDDGSVIGVVPTYDLSSGNPWLGTTIATGMGHGRNILVVASARVVIAIGGRAGTLTEIALAWSLGKPVLAVGTEQGWASRLAGAKVDDRREDHIQGPLSPAEAARLAISLSQSNLPPSQEF